MKPKAVVNYIRENQNNNKTLKSLFASHSIRSGNQFLKCFICV